MSQKHGAVFYVGISVLCAVVLAAIAVGIWYATRPPSGGGGPVQGSYLIGVNPWTFDSSRVGNKMQPAAEISAFSPSATDLTDLDGSRVKKQKKHVTWG